MKNNETQQQMLILYGISCAVYNKEANIVSIPYKNGREIS
jgi:hypothetical protein